MRTIQVTRIDTEHPIDMAARMLGGRVFLAEKLGVSVAAVGNWKQRGVPIEQCPRIEKITFCEVNRQALRPNDWSEIWPELAAPCPNSARGA